MEMKQASKDLLIALESEVLGEASFRSAYYASFSPERKKKAKALWKLEAQTKLRILEYFKKNNIEAPKLIGSAIKGGVLGIFFPIGPWSMILNTTLKETEHFLKVFNRLEQQAPEEDKELFKYIVAHEMAIKRFEELELEGKNSGSLEPIQALLVI